VNTGVTPTCVRDNGSSVVDLTWSSADVSAKFVDWRVLSDEISLSDHKYIVFRFGDLHGGHTSGHAHYVRWNTKTLDRELFEEILIWLCEGGFPAESVEGFSLHITDAVSATCGASAK